MAKPAKNLKQQQTEPVSQAPQPRPLTPKEAREQTVIGVITVTAILIVIGMIGYALWVQNRPQDLNALKNDVETTATKPTNANGDYGFTISKNGVNKPIQGIPTVTFYMDLMCPGCGNMERNTGTTTHKLVDAGQINLEVHPLSFMDKQSTDNYSTRAALAVINAMELAPDHVLDFIAAMYEQDFQPEEGNDYKPVTDDMIRQQAIKAGIPDDIAAKLADHKYENWLKNETTYTTARPELMQNKQFSTPVITINNTQWDWHSIDGNENMGDALAKAIGLDPSQVGDPNTPASIGADGKAVYPAK